MTSEALPVNAPRRALWTLFIFTLAARFLLLVVAPHTDPSESRYAEIARKMAETGNWVTPQFDYGVPFWAKPPLSMWLSATGIELFGAGQFGSRIFIFAAALVVLLIVARAAWQEWGRGHGLVAVAVLMAMPLFFYTSAAVMTDLPLVLGTTLAMVAFRVAERSGSRPWGYGFFLGLAIGLLAKGPLVWVLALPPIGVWVLAAGDWRRAWKNLPWITGFLLMLACAVPWYLLAEARTPGFLHYFLIGEHWLRFTVKGWQGDLYGSAHAQPRGMIWFHAIVLTFPWCLGLFAAPLARWRGWLRRGSDDGGAMSYWLCWALWPLLFFTPSLNIIASYPLPALPAIALLVAGVARYRGVGTISWRGFQPLHGGIALAAAGIIVFAVLSQTVMPRFSPKESERELVRRYQKERFGGDALLYYGARRYSAEFYSEGEATNTRSERVLADRMDAPGRLFVAVTRRSLGKIPANLRRRLELVSRIDKDSWLYAEVPLPEGMAAIHPADVSPIGN